MVLLFACLTNVMTLGACTILNVNSLAVLYADDAGAILYDTMFKHRMN